MARLRDAMAVTEESTSRFVKVDNINIHYNEAGTGDPPILCIHGAGPGASGWRNFSGNFQELALERRVLLIDMPGWGKTKYVPPGDQPLTSWAKLLRNFLDTLGIEAVDLIGNSMGGQMGIKLAIDYPERVKHLVVIGSQPTGAIPIQPLPQEGLRLIAEYYEGDGPSIERMRAVVRSLVYDDSSLTDDFIKDRYEGSITPNQVARGRDRRQVQDLYFELEKNRVPTLVVWGMEDRGGALEVGLLMTRRFQNARMLIFSKCGHWAQAEHRAAFDRLVLDFFKND
jgi:pimeloyl-ACP methyl ester carboxylesterase